MMTLRLVWCWCCVLVHVASNRFLELAAARWRFEAHWTALELAASARSLSASGSAGWLLYAPYRGRLGNQIESLLEASFIARSLGRALVLPVVAQTHDLALSWRSGAFADLFNVSLLQLSPACRAGCFTPDEFQRRHGRRLAQILHLTSRPLNDWHYRQARYELASVRVVALDVAQHPSDGGAAFVDQLRRMDDVDVIAVTELWKYVRVTDAHVADLVPHLVFRDEFVDAAARFRAQHKLCDATAVDQSVGCVPFVAVHLRLGARSSQSRNSSIAFDWQWWCDKQDDARAIDFHGAMVASGQAVDARRCFPSAQLIGDVLRHHRRRFDVLLVASDSATLPDDIDATLRALQFERVLRANSPAAAVHYFGPLAVDLLLCESAHAFVANDYSSASRFVVDRRRARGLWSDQF